MTMVEVVVVCLIVGIRVVTICIPMLSVSRREESKSNCATEEKFCSFLLLVR